MSVKPTEIIPKDMPAWATEAMGEGQLFNTTFNYVRELSDLVEDFAALCDVHGCLHPSPCLCLRADKLKEGPACGK